MVQGIYSHAAGIQGEKYGLFMAVLVCAYVVGKPAFHAAAMVVIGSGAFFPEIFPGLESINIEVPDVGANFFKSLNQFFVFGHEFFPFIKISIQKSCHKNNHKLRSVFEMNIFSYVIG